MKNIKMISITGGTCAGKTETFNKLKEVLGYEYDGVSIIYIPESGTEMMQRGISPLEGNLEEEFQAINLENQLSREALCKKAASKMKKNNILIICDRTSYEQQVFVSKEEWDKILKDMNLTNDFLMNSYDAIFHLVSTAIGAEAAYGMVTNANRYHTLEQAREQELFAQKLWLNHKNFKMYPNNCSFETKRERVVNDVVNFIKENY